MRQKYWTSSSGVESRESRGLVSPLESGVGLGTDSLRTAVPVDVEVLGAAALAIVLNARPGSGRAPFVANEDLDGFFSANGYGQFFRRRGLRDGVQKVSSCRLKLLAAGVSMVFADGFAHLAAAILKAAGYKWLISKCRSRARTHKDADADA